MVDQMQGIRLTVESAGDVHGRCEAVRSGATLRERRQVGLDDLALDSRFGVVA
jgi:hypothetical protein